MGGDGGSFQRAQVGGARAPNLAVFVAPPVLASLQLFTFGTYLPHRRPTTEAMAPHHARTQEPNHPWAMLSCYFFGYHWEHHQSPSTPWWRLWRVKLTFLHQN